MITHYKTVKQLMNYLQFLYSGKENFFHIYNVCKNFSQAYKGDGLYQLFFGHMTVSLYCFHNTDMEEQLNQNNKVGIKAMV